MGFFYWCNTKEKNILMNKETVAELQSIIYDELNTEVDTEQAKLLANDYTDYFNILKQIYLRSF